MLDKLTDFMPLIVISSSIGGVIFKLISNKIYLTGLEKDLETNLTKASRSLLEYVIIIIYLLCGLFAVILFYDTIFISSSKTPAPSKEYNKNEVMLILGDEETSTALLDQFKKRVNDSNISYIEKLEMKVEINDLFKATEKDEVTKTKEFNKLIKKIEIVQKEDFILGYVLLVMIIILFSIIYYTYRGIRKKDYMSRTYITIEKDDQTMERYYILKRFSSSMVLLKNEDEAYKLKELNKFSEETIYTETNLEISEKRHENYFELLELLSFNRKICSIKIIYWIIILLVILLLLFIVLYFYLFLDVFKLLSSLFVGFLIPLSYIAWQAKN